MALAQFKNTTVDLSGLLKVLGENLYSRPEVAVRELIQNASDAISRRKLQSDVEFHPRIDVHFDADQNILSIRDNGSGLTADEIDQFLARIGSGFTRSLKTQNNNLIGAFGLGFLTAYMIGEKVIVETTSADNPDIACRFVSENGEKYIITEIDPGPIGSTVIIHLKPAFENLLSYQGLRSVLNSYCRLMVIPIYFQDEAYAINLEPPWRNGDENMPAIRRRKANKTFAQTIEPLFDPVCTIPISGRVIENVDQTQDLPGQGLLWIHDHSTYGGADNRWMQIYVRGMMVCKNKRELLPAWAGFVSGLYESWALNPTASREDIQQDDAYESAKAQIATALVNGLAQLSRDEPEAWRLILRRHNEALLGAAIADPALFDVLKDDLLLPTTEGELTLKDIRERSATGFVVTTHTNGGADEIVARAFGTPVILGYRYGALAMAKLYAEIYDIDILELGTQAGHANLFPKVDVTAKVKEHLTELFGEDGITLRFSSFKPDFLSLVAIIDKEQELKSFYESEDADKKINAGALSLARNFTQAITRETEVQIVLNMSSDLIKTLTTTEGEKAQLAAGVLLSSARMHGTKKALGKEGFAAALKQFNTGLTTLVSDNQ